MSRLFRKSINLRVALVSTASLIGLWITTGGCADKSYSQRNYDRQNAALNDPMHYGPKPEEFGKDMPDVTRGGIGDSDRQGLKRDLDRVFNP